jgi:hypothetical protein
MKTVVRAWLVLLVFVFIQETVYAQTQIRLGDYNASMSTSVYQCSQGGDTNFTAKGVVSLVSQNGDNFTGTADLVVHKFGLVCEMSMLIAGKVDASANLTGSFRHDFICDNGFESSGSGTFTGNYSGLG